MKSNDQKSVNGQESSYCWKKIVLYKEHFKNGYWKYSFCAFVAENIIPNKMFISSQFHNLEIIS